MKKLWSFACVTCDKDPLQCELEKYRSLGTIKELSSLIKHNPIAGEWVERNKQYNGYAEHGYVHKNCERGSTMFSVQHPYCPACGNIMKSAIEHGIPVCSL